MNKKCKLFFQTTPDDLDRIRKAEIHVGGVSRCICRKLRAKSEAQRKQIKANTKAINDLLNNLEEVVTKINMNIYKSAHKRLKDPK